MTQPVVIAGGGPAGLMLAHELRLWGVDTVVLERQSTADARVPGQAINTTTAELLDQRGLLAALLPHSKPVQGTHFSLLWLDMSPLTDRHLPALLLGHQHIHRELERHARARGADLRRGHELLAFTQDSDGVLVTVRGPRGEYALRGSHLVAADGERSLVRRLADIAFPGAGRPNCGLVADLEVEPEQLPEVHRGSKFSTSGGVYSAVPTEPGVLRVITAEFDAEPAGDETPPTEDELRESIRRLNGAEFPPDVPVRWITRYGGPTRTADRYREGRVFLIGDAAHTFYPLAGMRMNLVVQDAVNLGWKLAADRLGWAPPGLLDTYDAERRPIGKRWADATDAQLSLIHPAATVGPLRALFTELLGFADVNRHLLELSTGLEVDYAPAGSGPLTGRRLPHVPLETTTGPSSVPRLLHGGRGVFLDLSGGVGAAGPAGWADRLDVVRAEPTPEIDAAAVLLRPDGHVAWAGDPVDDAKGVRSALEQWFGEPG